MRKSILMLANTGTTWDIVGEPVRAGSYYGYTDGMHTIQMIYQNFVGGIGIQGTLSLKPLPEDWFWIKINPSGDIHTPYMTFPLDPYSPTGANGGDTGSIASTFVGNFTFLRAVLVRDYLQPTDINPAWNTWQYGRVDKILLSL